jgi:predicted nucleotidyltransferase
MNLHSHLYNLPFLSKISYENKSSHLKPLLICSQFLCYTIIIRLDIMSQTTARKIDSYRKQIIDFCQKWRVKEFSVFGSFLRDDFNENSDVDVLLTFFQKAQHSLFDLVEMQEELQTIFSRRVDLVEKEGLRNPIRRKAILKDREVVYAA